MNGAVIDHLWQSTLFVLAAALVSVALRKNGAHMRHAVWVVASVKFLVPFAVLMSLGRALPMLTPGLTQAIAPVTAAAPDLPIAVDRIAQPFRSNVFSSTLSAAKPSMDRAAVAVAAVWAFGFVAVAVMRLRGWRRVRAARRASVPLSLAGPVPVRAAPGLLEPGVVGLWCPILLVPAGIEQHLTPAQLHAVLEHEFCHVRRRDNLTSAIHMVVEAAFWFHPLVWWVGARLVDERERACDEHVLRVCGEPRVYAESILSVCKLYVESPLPCVSGVTGSDLKKRVTAIMTNHVGLRLTLARKVALTLAAVLAIVLPLLAGMLTASLRAQSQTQASSSASARTTSGMATFDLVSIRPCAAPTPPTPSPRSGGRGGISPSAAQTSPGYIYWDCVTVAKLVEQAYADRDHPLLNTTTPRPDSFQPKRVRGGPSWAEKDMFTIEAKASIDLTNPERAGRPSRNLVALSPAMSQALRAMLEERFRLKVRRATEQQDMYALRVATKGLSKEQMPATKPGDCVTADEFFATDPASRQGLSICGRYLVTMAGIRGWHRNAWELTGMTLQQLASALSGMMDRFVLDQTGVNTPFTFVLEFSPEDPPGDDRFIAALERLGLKIEETKGPADYLVIESVEKPRPDTAAGRSFAPARARGAAER